MNAILVLTVIGPDRPGLVETLSRTLAEHGGNWQQSRMARLAGHFAGVLQASVPTTQVEPLTGALAALAAQGLNVNIVSGQEELPGSAARRLTLEVVGQDRPGIVRDITTILAAKGINVEALDTEYTSASWSGENLFQASAELTLPADVDLHELRDSLEALADELMVDLSLDGAPL